MRPGEGKQASPRGGGGLEGGGGVVALDPGKFSSVSNMHTHLGQAKAL